MTHVPLIGVNEDGDQLDDNSDNPMENAIVLDGGKTRQAWLRLFDKNQKYSFFRNFKNYLAGDIHNLQYVRADQKHLYPLQVIVGSGGVFLDKIGTCDKTDDTSYEKCVCHCPTFEYSRLKTDDGHWHDDVKVDGPAWKAFGYAGYNNRKITFYTVGPNRGDPIALKVLDL